MIAFTILGVLFFWLICWEVGYNVALHMDAKDGINKLLKPVENELAALVEVLAFFHAEPAKKETP